MGNPGSISGHFLKKTRPKNKSELFNCSAGGWALGAGRRAPGARCQRPGATSNAAGAVCCQAPGPGAGRRAPEAAGAERQARGGGRPEHFAAAVRRAAWAADQRLGKLQWENKKVCKKSGIDKGGPTASKRQVKGFTIALSNIYHEKGATSSIHAKQ